MNDGEMVSLLKRVRRLAVVGMSRNPRKAAHRVPAFLMSQGFEVIPVNPFAETIMGQTSYRHLREVPGPIDAVVVFRPSDEVLPVVDDALIRHRTRGDIELIWLQLGIVNETARDRTLEAGLSFVHDRCLAIEIPRLFPEGLGHPSEASDDGKSL
jgi:hypothetical protein